MGMPLIDLKCIEFFTKYSVSYSKTLIRSFLFVSGLMISLISNAQGERPNILLAISDDQSWVDASAYGGRMVETPHFDSVAKTGVLMMQAFAASPGCSPSRASLLTGRHTWMIEEAGTHASYFQSRYKVFPDLLEENDYYIGYTGKGWGPGDWKSSGRSRNPAGPNFRGKAEGGQSSYVNAFSNFLSERKLKSKESKTKQPFFFWFGSHDPHRSFAKGSGRKSGMKLEDAHVPKFLPDTDEIREDLLDYAFEIQRFDHDLGEMIELIRKDGALENTLIIVTSDNGMAFPRAKANCYEYGIHMPLAISWPARIKGDRSISDLVGFVDLTSTILDAANVPMPPDLGMSGRSFLNVLISNKSGKVDSSRSAVYSARERHSSSRFNSLGYPQRCIRTQKFLYIINFKPERWPAGPAQKFNKARYDASGGLVSSSLGPSHGGYHDIDACPSLSFLIQNRNHSKFGRYLELAVGKRPEEELYDIKNDPDCLNNLVTNKAYNRIKSQLRSRLWNYLYETGDPRVKGNGDIWETYPRVSSMRWFPQPEWVGKKGYHLPEMRWLESRRPKK